MHLRTFMSAAMGSMGVLTLAKDACMGNVALRGEDDRDDDREAERRLSKFMVVVVCCLGLVEIIDRGVQTFEKVIDG